jgi:hypothetical protein
MIDIPKQLHTVRLPIKKSISLSQPLESDFPNREFVFESIDGSGSLWEVLIYRERTAELSEGPLCIAKEHG